MPGRLSPLQRVMLDALRELERDPESFRPGINLHGAGQHAAGRALARRGLVTFYPAIGRVELSPAESRRNRNTTTTQKIEG